MVLMQSEISIDRQLVSRDAEFDAANAIAVQRIERTEQPHIQRLMETERLEKMEDYQKNRSRMLRAKSGVLEVLVEAKYIREQFSPGIHYLIDELHEMSVRCRELEAAIGKHRKETLEELDHELDEQSEMDDELWSHLSPEAN
jgi:septal ring factor EnvC (AmiA/AmiB activator)